MTNQIFTVIAFTIGFWIVVIVSIIVIIKLQKYSNKLLFKSLSKSIAPEIDGEILEITRCSLIEHMMYSGSLSTMLNFYKVRYIVDDTEYTAIYKKYPLDKPLLFKDKI